MALLFEDAVKAKNAIVASQQKEIAKLYDDWANDVAERAKFYSYKTNASAPLSERYYQELYKQMKATSKVVSDEVAGIIKGNMYTIADSVVADNVKWLESFGFSPDGLNAAFSHVPHDVVQMLVTGQVYQGGWNLSQRIWSDNQETQKDIYQIMARGLAEQKSVFAIAKDLESYVRPGAKKAWNPILAMKNTKTGQIEYKKVYKKQVDYNAQRLARTLAQHTYQQSFIATTKDNPFITEYIWRSNGSRVCPLCMARDGKHFKKDELPMDHPNGMCTMEPAVAEDMVDQLANWFNSPDGTYPEIDAFAGNFGYEVKPVSQVKTIADYINKYGAPSYKSAYEWLNGLTPEQKEELKLLKEQQPEITFEKWYKKNFYKPDTSGVSNVVNIAAKTAEVPTTKSTGAVNSAQDFINKYGTSTKSPNAWFSSLTPEQKADAKLLKEQSGLGWNDWYMKNVYAGSKTTTAATNATVKAATTKATAAAKTTTAKVAEIINPIVSNANTDSTFNVASWNESLSKNDLSEFDNWTKSWLKTISSSEKSGVVTYTGEAYWDMNEYLRGQRATTKYKAKIEACKSALSKASLPKETIVRRGSNYNMLDELGLGAITPDNKHKVIGAILKDEGFTSTSPNPHGGFYRNVTYVIKLPEGSQAAYVDSISKHKGEKELLINCGGKYMVEDVEFDNKGNVEKIYMTLKNLNNLK